MSVGTLKLAAARYALGCPINRDLCSPALAELWLTRTPTLRDSGPAFEKAMREVGIPLPTKAEAAGTLSIYLITRIVEGSLSPREGVRRIAEEVCGWSVRLEPPAAWTASDSFRSLAHCYYDYHYWADLFEVAPELEAEIVTTDGKVRALATEVHRELCPVTVNPVWLSWNRECVARIARAIAEEHRFEDLPVLADALEEAGCTNADVLDHCREPGEHAQKCWVLELLLGSA